MKYAAALALFSGLAVGACASSVRGQVASYGNHMQPLSVCSLVGHDTPPNETEVRISAFFLTDYLERSVITDPACPSVRLALYADPAAKEEEADRYQRLVVKSTMRDDIENRGTGVYAIDITGHFVYRKNERPQIAIYADHVWSFKRLPCTAFYSAAKCKGMD